MKKPFFYVLGLSMTLFFVVGCGRGFDANTNKRGGNTGGGPVVEDTTRPVIDERVKELVKIKNDENLKTNSSGEEMDLVTDVVGNADDVFKAISARKTENQLLVTLVMRSLESEPTLAVDFALPMGKDGETLFSTPEMVKVGTLDGEIANAVEFQKQFLVVYECVSDCSEFRILHLQRVITRTEVAGKKVISGNMASFVFEFAAEIGEGTLKLAKPFKTGTLKSFREFFIDQETLAADGLQSNAEVTGDDSAAIADDEEQVATETQVATQEAATAVDTEAAAIEETIRNSGGPRTRNSAGKVKAEKARQEKAAASQEYLRRMAMPGAVNLLEDLKNNSQKQK